MSSTPSSIFQTSGPDVQALLSDSCLASVMLVLSKMQGFSGDPVPTRMPTLLPWNRGTAIRTSCPFLAGLRPVSDHIVLNFWRIDDYKRHSGFSAACNQSRAHAICRGLSDIEAQARGSQISCAAVGPSAPLRPRWLTGCHRNLLQSLPTQTSALSAHYITTADSSREVRTPRPVPALSLRPSRTSRRLRHQQGFMGGIPRLRLIHWVIIGHSIPML
jgi:hypothetical protein